MALSLGMHPCFGEGKKGVKCIGALYSSTHTSPKLRTTPNQTPHAVPNYKNSKLHNLCKPPHCAHPALSLAASQTRTQSPGKGMRPTLTQPGAGVSQPLHFRSRKMDKAVVIIRGFGAGRDGGGWKMSQTS